MDIELPTKQQLQQQQLNNGLDPAAAAAMKQSIDCCSALHAMVDEGQQQRDFGLSTLDLFRLVQANSYLNKVPLLCSALLLLLKTTD